MFEVLTVQDGIHLPEKGDHRMLGLSVIDAMRAIRTFSPDITAAAANTDAAVSLQLSRDRAIVLETGGVLCGVVTRAMLNSVPGSTTLRDIAAPTRGYRVFPDQPLSTAFSKLGKGAFVVPVVSRLNPDGLLGIVTTEDALKAYGIARDNAAGEPQVAPSARESNIKDE